MVQMISPWKHPDTGIYYLYKELPQYLRAEMGRRQIRRSLKTRDPAEAKRLFVAAHAQLQREMDEAEMRVAARRATQEISPERAAIIVDAWIRSRPGGRAWLRWPTLGDTFLLEEAASNMQGQNLVGLLPSTQHEAEGLVALRGQRLAGDGWLEFVRTRTPSAWLQASRHVLDPIFDTADPPIERLPANELLIMQAWNARVLADNTLLRADVETPRRAGSKPRARPDLMLRELLKLWGEHKKPRPQSYAEAERSVDDMISYLGDIPVCAITSDMLLDYRDEAKRLPAGMPRADRALPFHERLAKHAATDAPRVSPNTVKKRIGSIQSLLSFAHQERWVEHNEGLGVRIAGFSRTARTRRSFQNNELASLFGSTLFLRPDRLLDRRTSVSDLTLYWLFLLGLTSGARLEEVGQARIADVKEDGGIIYIDVDDYAGTAEDSTLPQKSIKTPGSRRIIPIHDRVLELGFQTYVEALRAADRELLFPDLRPSTHGKLTKEASRRLNRHINAVVSKDERLVFYSLRHRFKDEGREADVQERILDQLCGHVPATVGGRYGDGVGLASLKRSLGRLRFEPVPWDAITAAVATLNWKAMADGLLARHTAGTRQ